MKLQYFASVKTVKELKKQYHKLVLKNHPDKGGDHETMVAIVLEYEWALAHLFDGDGNRRGGAGAEADGSHGSYDAKSDGFREALDKLMGLDGLEIEVCGDWIWVGGNTFQNKAAIKEIGCFWAKKKQLWYWKPADYSGGKRKKTLEMSEIRSKYGSDIFKSNGQKVLSA